MFSPQTSRSVIDLAFCDGSASLESELTLLALHSTLHSRGPHPHQELLGVTRMQTMHNNS